MKRTLFLLLAAALSLVVYAAENDVLLTQEDANGNYVRLTVSDGTAGQFLSTDGAGVWSFADAAGGLTPAPLPVSGTPWVVGSTYNGNMDGTALGGAYSIPSFSGATTQGQRIQATIIVFNDDVTVSCPAVLRAPDSGTALGFDLPVGNHFLTFEYDGGFWWLVDTGDTVTAANTVYAGPASGGDSYASMRALVDADIPDDISVAIRTSINAASRGLAPQECYGGVHYVTGPGVTLTAAGIQDGMSVTVISNTPNPITVNPAGANRVILDGVDLAPGHKVVSPGAPGDLLVLTYYGAGTWYGTSNGWVDGDL